MLGNGLACDIVGVGDVQVCFDNGSTFTLHDVRHVPFLTENMVSAGQLDDVGYTCTFGDSSWKISKGVLQVAQGLKSSTLYVLHVSSFSKNVICIAKQPSVSLWHRRLGHMSKARMQVLSWFGFIPGLNFSDFSVCEHCLYGKQIANSHSIVSQKWCEPLELVHSDVCDPMPTI